VTSGGTLVRVSALYGIRAAELVHLLDLCEAGALRKGPAPFIERQEGPFADERTDRSRAFPPHVADVLYENRFCGAAAEEPWASASRGLTRVGLSPDWFEIVVFAAEADARELEKVPARVRGEVTTAVATMHFVLNDEAAFRATREITSRAAQDIHAAVRDFLDPVGRFRSETFRDLMDASELPFVVGTAIDPTSLTHAEAAGARAIGRNAQAPEVCDANEWRVLLWPDAAVVATTRFDDTAYRLGKRTMNVALSVVLDALLLRFAQRQILEMLARRVASGGGVNRRSVAALHASAVRLRSRVWWPRVSLEPFVETPSTALADVWALPELARDVFEELEALAQQARLVTDRRIGQILFVLTAGSLAIALSALVVQVVTSTRIPAAVVAALAPTTVVAVLGWLVYTRTLRGE